jgi:hypothetical protein
MNTKTNLIALTAATLIAIAPTAANAANLSDAIFSWPTAYKTQTVSQATSTFDGQIKTSSVRKLEIQKQAKNKAIKSKRK